MPNTPVVQPFGAALKAKDIYIREAAELIGCPVRHLTEVVAGRVRPNDDVRRLAPIITGKPLDQLFLPDRLKRPHRNYVRTAPFPRKSVAA